MAKMVKPLLMLEQAVLSLLGQWEDHPGLQRILDTIRMLLTLPYSTPLAKVKKQERLILEQGEGDEFCQICF